MSRTSEERLQALEDREAIRELRATYCFLVDDGRGEELVDTCFTTGARCEFRPDPEGPFPPLVATGREELLGFFTGILCALLRDMRHTVHNHRIELDGDTASGDCYFELTATDAGDGQALVGAGRYVDRYRRVDGAWRFEDRCALLSFIAPLADGWVNRRFSASLAPPND